MLAQPSVALVLHRMEGSGDVLIAASTYERGRLIDGAGKPQKRSM